MTDSTDLIQKARELCKAATPGPWAVDVITGSDDQYSGYDDDHVVSRGIDGPGGVGLNTGVEYQMFSEGDADLMAAAPTLLLELADALEAEVGERKPEESLLTQRHADMILNDRSELRRVNRELIRELANHKAKMVD